MIERLADIFCLNNDLRSSFNELSVSLASSCLVPRPHFALLGHCYCPTLVVSWKKFCVMVFGVLLVKHAPFGLCGLQEMVSRWLLCLTGLHVIQRRLSRWATSRPDGRVSWGGGRGRERGSDLLSTGLFKWSFCDKKWSTFDSEFILESQITSRVASWKRLEWSSICRWGVWNLNLGPKPRCVELAFVFLIVKIN